jgi:hypothetical protein
MTINEAGWDRVVRVLVGLALLAFLIFDRSPYRWFGLIGLAPLLTGIIGWCPGYTLLGVRTCPLKTPDAK